MALENILQYQGRVPKRSGSLAKRNHILQSTLDIIYSEGLRGVRHRAVADLAKVPLSATTYYFKDIDELIVDSFVYFMELNIQHQQAAFSEISAELNSNEFKMLSKKKIIAFIHGTFVSYVEQQISDKVSRMIEASFIQYATRVPVLASKIEQIHRYFENQIASILDALAVKDSLFKAQLILGFIHYTEEKAMLSGNADSKAVHSDIEQLLDIVLV